MFATLFSRFEHTTMVCWGGCLNKYQSHAGDGLQLTLRSSFQPRPDAWRSASFAMPLWCLHLSGTLVRCVQIEEVVCSKALKVCIGMARLN